MIALQIFSQHMKPNVWKQLTVWVKWILAFQSNFTKGTSFSLHLQQLQNALYTWISSCRNKFIMWDVSLENCISQNSEQKNIEWMLKSSHLLSIWFCTFHCQRSWWGLPSTCYDSPRTFPSASGFLYSVPCYLQLTWLVWILKVPSIFVPQRALEVWIHLVLFQVYQGHFSV